MLTPFFLYLTFHFLLNKFINFFAEDEVNYPSAYVDDALHEAQK